MNTQDTTNTTTQELDTTWSRGFRQVILPETILPLQYFRPPRPVALRHGPYAIMWAVLEDALDCVFGIATVSCTKKGRYRLAQEAHDWFMNEDQRWLFSFANVCAFLDLEPGRIRQQIDERFRALTPPPKKAPWVKPPRAYARVRFNKQLYYHHKPAWLPQVDVRKSGHQPFIMSLPPHEETEEAARSRSQEYITAGHWRQYLDVMKPEGQTNAA